LNRLLVVCLQAADGITTGPAAAEMTEAGPSTPAAAAAVDMAGDATAAAAAEPASAEVQDAELASEKSDQASKGLSESPAGAAGDQLLTADCWRGGGGT